MPRHPSRAPRRRIGRRAAARPNNRAGTAVAAGRKHTLTNLIAVYQIIGQATKCRLIFDFPVYAQLTQIASATDIVATCNGEPTRHADTLELVRPNEVRATLSGALTAGKTYALTIAAGAQVIVPRASKLGIRNGALSTVQP